jgi:ABC-type uncharacterized transport system auxiliary subunit
MNERTKRMRARSNGADHRRRPGQRCSRWRFAAVGLLSISCALLAACAARIPETSYYRLVPPVATLAPEREPDGVVLVVDELRVDTAYDDDRIAYRTSPYRLDYYEYHRWSAPPGLLVSDFLRSAYAKTGEFDRVVRELEPEAQVILSGRVIALEEIDRTELHWFGNVEIELELRDADTSRVLWSTRIHERESLDERSPEGLARATSRALRRAVARTAPEIARAAQEREPVAFTDRG